MGCVKELCVRRACTGTSSVQPKHKRLVAAGFNFMRPYGSYAEFISVPEQTVAGLPDSISFEAGAALPLVTMTAMQASQRQH